MASLEAFCTMRLSERQWSRRISCRLCHHPSGCMDVDSWWLACSFRDEPAGCSDDESTERRRDCTASGIAARVVLRQASGKVLVVHKDRSKDRNSVDTLACTDRSGVGKEFSGCKVRRLHKLKDKQIAVDLVRKARSSLVDNIPMDSNFRSSLVRCSTAASPAGCSIRRAHKAVGSIPCTAEGKPAAVLHNSRNSRRFRTDRWTWSHNSCKGRSFRSDRWRMQAG